MTKGVGTLAYMSPEMLNEEDYDYKTDVYSFGVVLYVMFVGSLPKLSMKNKMTGKTPKMPEPSPSISKSCIDLISKCMSYKPAERPTFEQILQMIRDISFKLASYVDTKIIGRIDKELQSFDK